MGAIGRYAGDLNRPPVLKACADWTADDGDTDELPVLLGREREQRTLRWPMVPMVVQHVALRFANADRCKLQHATRFLDKPLATR